MSSRTVTANFRPTEKDEKVEQVLSEVDREKEEVEEQPILLLQSFKTEEEETVSMLPVLQFRETIQLYPNRFRLKKWRNRKIIWMAYRAVWRRNNEQETKIMKLWEAFLFTETVAKALRLQYDVLERRKVSSALET